MRAELSLAHVPAELDRALTDDGILALMDPPQSEKGVRRAADVGPRSGCCKGAMMLICVFFDKGVITNY